MEPAAMLPGRSLVFHCLQGRARAVWGVVVEGWNSGRYEGMDPAGLGRKFHCQFIDAIRSDEGEGEGERGKIALCIDTF